MPLSTIFQLYRGGQFYYQARRRSMYKYISGADPGFQAKGAHLKKLRRAEGGTNIFGVFRVKNHDFMPKNHISPPDPPLVFSNIKTV
jgi:hypothetical protein